MKQHSASSMAVLLLGLVLASLSAVADNTDARQEEWKLHNGRLMENGEWVFLKIGNPLRNFAKAKQCRRLIEKLDVLKSKGYNALELNCYWHHFDPDGDGEIDVSLKPLAKLINAIHARGMFPCLSVETYGVGGGTVPGGFWKKYPDAEAVDSKGNSVRDDEYGFNSRVPSLFHKGYLKASNRFVRELTKAVTHQKILYYETSVEPQFMGKHDIGYSEEARNTYERWRKHNNIDGPAWPESSPVPESFRRHPVWLRFRAEYLAHRVNKEAEAYRSVAGEDAYIAVDYLDTCGGEMYKRNGNSIRFPTALTSADILQVNWHWHVGRRAPNKCAYEKVRKVMKKTGREWAITEHMTLNGKNFRSNEVKPILNNALKNGTGYGFEFVNVVNSSNDPFALYNDDWSPKPLIAEVDRKWSYWKKVIKKTLSEKKMKNE